MIGIIFIIGITLGVGYLVYLASMSKVTLIDGKITFNKEEKCKKI